jgi:hypothetical protein
VSFPVRCLATSSLNYSFGSVSALCNQVALSKRFPGGKWLMQYLRMSARHQQCFLAKPYGRDDITLLYTRVGTQEIQNMYLLRPSGPKLYLTLFRESRSAPEEEHKPEKLVRTTQAARELIFRHSVPPSPIDMNCFRPSTLAVHFLKHERLFNQSHKVAQSVQFTSSGNQMVILR